MFSTEINYEVVNFSIGDTKSGTKMGKLQLKNPDDNTILNCILWEEALLRMEEKIFRCGNTVRIISGSFNEKFNNCLINSLELITEAKIGLDDSQREETFAELSGYIDKIKDKKLQTFVKNFYNEHSSEIKTASAAKLIHHNYVGGLMVHTLECLKLADVNMKDFFHEVNRDEVYAACLLHDIGKIFEYTVNLESGLIDYDENFKKDWISHTQYAFTLCMSNGFKSVGRMIAAHHARTDWGALIDLNEKDLEPEVYLIHHLDDLSAKFGKTNVAAL